MRIDEVASPDSQKLVALSQFLAGRAEDTTAKKEIKQQAFINLAKSLGVNIDPEQLSGLIGQPPLSNVLEPLDIGSDVIRFKGAEEPVAGMSVDQAEQVVNQNAKSALKRRQ